MPFPADLTWTCHVCGDERPDEQISVFTKNDKIKGGGMSVPVSANVRYCNDRAECTAKAPAIADDWLHYGEEKP